MLKTISFLMVFIFAPMGLAQTVPGVSFGVGSLGATLEAGLRLGPGLGLRGIAGYGSGDFSQDYNGAPLAGTATIGGYGVLADIYLGGGTRFSAGAIVPKYSADIAITGDLTLNGTPISNIDIVGRIDSIRPYAPVFAFGYEKSFGRSWGLSADLGAIYTGGFALVASDNSGQIPQADLDAELASTNTRLGNITFLPFVKLGVSFGF